MSFEYFETRSNNGLPLRWLDAFNSRVSEVKGSFKKRKWSLIVKHFVRMHYFSIRPKLIENRYVVSRVGGD
jgi:hypothetical protein